MERAYDDPEGVTAAFNRNLLDRINRELGGDFDVDGFEHRAVWNAEHRRVEMHLVAQGAQHARIGDHHFRFRSGTGIRTECSHKYDLDRVRALAAAAGCELTQSWTDPKDWFAVHWLAVP